MKKSINDNKYQEGEVVFAISSPSEKLVIRRYVDRIYYCIISSHPDQKELPFFERELTTQAVSPDAL